jgi:hypothetical protein
MAPIYQRSWYLIAGLVLQAIFFLSTSGGLKLVFGLFLALCLALLIFGILKSFLSPSD